MLGILSFHVECDSIATINIRVAGIVTIQNNSLSYRAFKDRAVAVAVVVR